MNRVLKFETNVPVKLALQTTQGLRIGGPGKWQMLFVTVSGQRVYFPEETAATIKRIVKSDEPFFVCRRHGRYDVWLAPESEKARAAEEAPEVAKFLNEVEPDAGSQPALANQGMAGRPRGTESASPLPKTDGQPGETGKVLPFPVPTRREPDYLKPTGTDSLPVPALQKHDEPPTRDVCEKQNVAVRIRPASTPPSRPTPPGRVGYGEVLAHICATVKRVLSETNLQLGDAPTQDLISTVFIAAQKDKAIDFDFGEAA